MKNQVLLFILLSGIFVSSFSQTNRQNVTSMRTLINQVTVPNLIGQNLATAVQLIDSLGLVRGSINEMRSNQPAGTVLRQFPAAGLIVSKGTSVNLYVSMGQTPARDPDATGDQPVLVQPARRARVPSNLIEIQQVQVPQLIGQNYNPDEITTILTRAGLRLGKSQPVVDSERYNRIVGQEPAAGQFVRPRTLVNITYGIQEQAPTPGIPQNVTVPDYLGMNVDLVTRRLPNDRLSPGAQKKIPSDLPSGTILAQFPPPGSVVDPNTPVSLSFSAGPQDAAKVRVPQLIGRTLQESAEILNKLNLFAGLLKEQVTDKPEGEVLYQSPAAGTLVNAGSSINMTYSVRPRNEYIRVPDVTGMTEDKARELLSVAGLTVEDVYSQKSDAPDGIVISQTPYPDEEVAKGTRAALILSENNSDQAWIYWGGGIVAALLLGSYIGWKTAKPKPDNGNPDKKAPKLKLVVVPDAGKQTIYSGKSADPIHGLQLKIIPDPGIQTLKTS
ncbi:MAG: PASTA domain-containing protein [Prolixibacteraceae bacterium]